jgi:hypothetical protein
MLRIIHRISHEEYWSPEQFGEMDDATWPITESETAILFETDGRWRTEMFSK